ncbi:MAG: EAL domain-containing protein [Lachnospiraceae bacterium]|nr:EAL domain-containing protein [Lachnospiraceae bacterium]
MGNALTLDYTYAADIATMAIVITCFILAFSSYTIKRRNYAYVVAGLGFIMISAATNVSFHYLIDMNYVGSYMQAHVWHTIRQVSLIFAYSIFLFYVKNLLKISGSNGKIITWSTIAVGAFANVFVIISNVMHAYSENAMNLRDIESVRSAAFNIAYVFYSVQLMLIIFTEGRKFIRKIRYSFVGIMVLAIGLVAIQNVFGMTTFTTLSFAIPPIAVLFFFHNNAYAADTGLLDFSAFDAFLRTIEGKSVSMLSLKVYDASDEKIAPIRDIFVDYNRKHFRNSYTFKINPGEYTMIYKRNENLQEEKYLQELIDKFRELKKIRPIDSKIVKMTSELTKDIGYLTSASFLNFKEYIEDNMEMNTDKICSEEDIIAYEKYMYIVSQVQEIARKSDLSDERVKVFCQPVLNTKNGKFETAEALMRLELPKYGMVFPDQFISILEKFDLIHEFTKIILNKTCKAIAKYESKGMNIERISVNVALKELRSPRFCADIIGIIKMNNISPSKVALEITESQNLTAQDRIKAVMEELRENGIVMYLDDFGTGYSNFERIIGLPFDIVKFDRSLTILSGKDEKSFFMVKSFSDIFKNANHSILFEGVEDENDEERCIRMNAGYLQGFKYSRPIPVEKLGEFLDSKSA